MNANEELAKAVLSALHRELDRQGWNSYDTLARAVRAAGWLPLTEVEGALRRDWSLVCRDHHTYPDCLPHVSAADFVGSLGRKP